MVLKRKVLLVHWIDKFQIQGRAKKETFSAALERLILSYQNQFSHMKTFVLAFHLIDILYPICGKYIKLQEPV